MKINYLKLNDNKTEFILIGSKQKLNKITRPTSHVTIRNSTMCAQSWCHHNDSGLTYLFNKLSNHLLTRSETWVEFVNISLHNLLNNWYTRLRHFSSGHRKFPSFLTFKIAGSSSSVETKHGCSSCHVHQAFHAYNSCSL